MTDEIKVGDRFLVPVEILSQSAAMSWLYRCEMADKRILDFDEETLSTCQRLPPEIGVGDEVSYKPLGAYKASEFTVEHLYGDWAWIRRDLMQHFLALCSDLTLVKKAEKG